MASQQASGQVVGTLLAPPGILASGGGNIVTNATGNIETNATGNIIGGAAVAGAVHVDAAFGEVTGVAAGTGGVLFVTDKTNHRVWKLAP